MLPVHCSVLKCNMTLEPLRTVIIREGERDRLSGSGDLLYRAVYLRRQRIVRL